ncbi:low molecular weight protein-tyrosine-phosphatase [Anaerolentibacter hominis]|uniref:low molecular weight protein-tyrosine-phosphatase n=1 Tax=Anaerolentibacter hominis TaxID=3079009 RepID=UPI0031B82788
MIKILFVCLGNICRSPMAEFVFRDMAVKRGLGDKFIVASAATSSEEMGNPVHHGTRDKLREKGISVKGKYSQLLKKADYEKYDYLIGMEQRNLANMRRILGGDPEHKMFCLLDFSDRPRDIADPWYTGDFDSTYEDICEGCEALLNYILKDL